MDPLKKGWLPNLVNAVPKNGYGNRLTMYLMSLEAWRRGLSVKFYLKENRENRLLIRYEINNGNRSYKFNSARSKDMPIKTVDICENKEETKWYLKRAQISVPEGKRFNLAETNEEILSFAEKIRYPVVLKPLSANAGKGVFSNIRNKEQLENAIDDIKTLGYYDVLLEEKVEGIEYRILVLNDRVLAAVRRVPANVVGDGVSSIEDLIKSKNKEKRKNPNLFNRDIIVDNEIVNNLENFNYDLNTILPKGKRFFLRDKVALDGDPVDATNELTETDKKLAIKAVQSISGLTLCGLDVMIDRQNEKFTVIEMNTRPMIGLHMFPMEGLARDVVAPIIDYYFPETKGKPKSNLYFDFSSVISPIRDRSVKEVALKTLANPHPYYSKRLLIGEFSGSYKVFEKIANDARQLNIYGKIKELSNNNWELIIASYDKAKVNDFCKMIKTELKRDGVSIYSEKEWEYPVNIGFKVDKIDNRVKRIVELRRSMKSERARVKKYIKANKKLQNKIQKVERKNKKLIGDLYLSEKNIHELERKLKLMQNSTSWRLTKPMRALSSYLKKFRKQ